MRTLAKPNNNKNNSGNNKNKQINKANTQQPTHNNNKSGKPQSKKVMKTIFHSPFHYKIQTLSSQDCQNVISVLLEYSKTLRKQFGSEIKPINSQKVIKFDSKVNYEKPTLIVKDYIYGIKQCLAGLKKEAPIQMIIYFYEQSKHDNFQELMCYNIHHKTPYIIIRENTILRKELGLKNLLALGITNEEIANNLSMFCSRCMMQIPWLVNTEWISLK